MDPSQTSGASGFRFSRAEVAEMEVVVRRFDGRRVTSTTVFDDLARRFTASREHEGKPGVQPKQVRNWFHNRHYHREPRILKNGKKDTLEEMPLLGYAAGSSILAKPSAASHAGSSSGNNHKEDNQFNFEAKSKRDGAWYTVDTFLSHRKLESGDQEIMVRFCGFGAMEDEWVDLHQCVRRRSLPCQATDCVAVEGKEQALNFDAYVLDVQRRRHDLRGCRCRFLICYAHDKTQEIVPSIKLCRRPESEYRLQTHAAGVDFANLCALSKEADVDLTTTQKRGARQKELMKHKIRSVKADEEAIMVRNPEQEDQPTVNTTASMPSAASETSGPNVTNKGHKGYYRNH